MQAIEASSIVKALVVVERVLRLERLKLGRIIRETCWVELSDGYRRVELSRQQRRYERLKLVEMLHRLVRMEAFVMEEE